jgi:Protein of unknown function (DUF559)
VFTAAQARAEGWTDRMIRRRIVAGRWVYVAGRALAEPSDRWTAFQFAMAAHLSLPKAVISHRTAGALHGFPEVFDEQVCEVILGVHRRAGRAITAHLLRLDPAEIEVSRSGLPITSPRRTAIDCLATLSFVAALDLWAWVSSRQILDRSQLGEAIEARRNWYGTAQLRRIDELVADGAVSAAEHLFHELLRQAGIGGWTANLPIRDGVGLIGRPDVAFPEQMLIVEIDGFRAHLSRASFIADRQRQNRLVAAGYTVLRFTWHDLTTRPSEVIAEILHALAAASGRRF